MDGKYKELDMSGLKLSKTRDYAVYLALKSSGQGKGEKVLATPPHPPPSDAIFNFTCRKENMGDFF